MAKRVFKGRGRILILKSILILILVLKQHVRCEKAERAARISRRKGGRRLCGQKHSMACPCLQILIYLLFTINSFYFTNDRLQCQLKSPRELESER